VFADGVYRAAKVARCRKCRAIVIRGLDHDRCARLAVVNPAPLSVVSEALALMAGRAASGLTAWRTAYQIDARLAANIKVPTCRPHPG
jgi:hypothetical protein